jgi:hypothetical protein
MRRISTDAVGVGRGVLGGHFAVGLQILLVAGDPDRHAPEVAVLHGRLVELCCIIIINHHSSFHHACGVGNDNV